MNKNDHFLYILNDGMAANIPRMVQMTTAMLETPQAPRQNLANAQIPVQRPMNAYLLWRQAEGEIIGKQRPKNEKLSSYSSRVWRDLNPEIKKFYFEEANKQSKAYEVNKAQNKQTRSIEKPKKSSSQSTALNSSGGEDWFEKMTITTAADPPFSSFNVQPKIDANWRPCSLPI
ncbi:hypothetical protein CAEBREN_25531 [Caenorhabditis brenneri]|uniref:HMG box domain-containing protein n=1 Tax=Caenorhabditis brenneri TaxID=135651 RepID=G0NHZ1_CAEBE|nr:hypothetical protein CAEBREN_25531 [Caenorhabditis brenneri]